jgi:Tfp pilus assembly protein PilF
MNIAERKSLFLLKKLVNILLIIAFVNIFWGCGTEEEKKAKHLANAQKYVKSLEYRKAVIEYKNVVQIDPKDDSAHYLTISMPS